MGCLMKSWNHRQGTFLTVRLPMAKIEPPNYIGHCLRKLWLRVRSV